MTEVLDSVSSGDEPVPGRMPLNAWRGPSCPRVSATE